MIYEEVIDYLYSRLPMFTRDGASAFKKDLTNITKLCEALGNPQNQFRSIHIAGTNGKGSSSHMLASICQAAGYRTALYTSPHLLDFRERIKVNGNMLSKEYVIDFINNHKQLIENVQPSFFEVTVALAFAYFASMKVDIAVIETGLGGRLDSTNIIRPVLSLITNISYDHTNLLGNSLTAIATEKAGIIKEKIPVIISERQNEIDQVFTEYAAQKQAPIFFATDSWEVSQVEMDAQYQYVTLSSKQDKGSELLRLDLRGHYQQKNILGVQVSVEQLNENGYHITPVHVAQGLSAVQKNTGLLGRWQTLSTSPLIICDTGHNESGWQEVIKNIKTTPYLSLHIVLGVMRDKDLESMLAILPQEAQYYFCNPQFDRALPATILQNEASKFQLKGQVYTSVEDALKDAKRQAKKKDLIFIGGSTFVVAEALPLFGFN